MLMNYLVVWTKFEVCNPIFMSFILIEYSNSSICLESMTNKRRKKCVDNIKVENDLRRGEGLGVDS